MPQRSLYNELEETELYFKRIGRDTPYIKERHREILENARGVNELVDEIIRGDTTFAMETNKYLAGNHQREDELSWCLGGIRNQPYLDASLIGGALCTVTMPLAYSSVSLADAVRNGVEEAKGRFMNRRRFLKVLGIGTAAGLVGGPLLNLFDGMMDRSKAEVLDDWVWQAFYATD